VAPGDLARAAKKIEVEDRTLVCIDETAFYLLPSVVRTWGPKGQTPILDEVYSRDHFSAISAITPQGKLYLHLQKKALDGADVVHFLCHLLRQIPGKLLVVWDGATIHYNETVRRLLHTDKDQDLWLARLPAYAPELNPDEGIWQYLKNVELPNLCCLDLEHLHREILKAVARVRHKTHLIKACFKQAGLQL
jgi:transposase